MSPLSHPTAHSTIRPCPPLRAQQLPDRGAPALGAAGVPGGCERCPGWSRAVLGTLCWLGVSAGMQALGRGAGGHRMLRGTGCSGLRGAHRDRMLTGVGYSPVGVSLVPGAHRCSPHHLRQPRVPLGSQQQPLPWLLAQRLPWAALPCLAWVGIPVLPCCDPQNPLLLPPASSTTTSSTPISAPSIPHCSPQNRAGTVAQAAMMTLV